MELSEEFRIFLLEGYELLDSVESNLLVLETEPQKHELVDQVFRAIHTIKGNSGFLGLSNLENFCHITESLLGKVRSADVVLSSELVTVLLRSRDMLFTTLQTIESTGHDEMSESDEILVELSQYSGA